MPELQQIVDDLSKLRFNSLSGVFGYRPEQRMCSFTVAPERNGIILTLADPARPDMINHGQAIFSITRIFSWRGIIHPEQAGAIVAKQVKQDSIGGSTMFFPTESLNAQAIKALASEVGKPKTSKNKQPSESDFMVTKSRTRMLGIKVLDRIERWVDDAREKLNPDKAGEYRKNKKREKSDVLKLADETHKKEKNKTRF